jgi:hypothetical protein
MHFSCYLLYRSAALFLYHLVVYSNGRLMQGGVDKEGGANNWFNDEASKEQ